jgi:2,5-furandicarboxylate decarboxylase 1
METLITLRSLIERLEGRQQLIRVTREVDPAFEITALSRKLHERYRKAVLFEKVKGHSLPVITYLFPDRESVGEALGMPSHHRIPWEWYERENTRVPFQEVKSGPVKEIIRKEPDLDSLPIPTHSDGDAGPYITGGVVIVKHPESGAINASFNRLQLLGRDKLHVRMMPPQHLGLYHAEYEKLNQPLEAAIVIGAPPAVMFSAASKIPYDRDELEFAGALARQPISVTRGETVDVMVPSESEIVIEGKVLPHVREDEGPFGEFTDSYVPVMKNHVFRATAILRRKDAIYHDIYAGGREDLLLLGIPIEAEVFKHIYKYANDITGIATNSFVFGCVIGIRKRDEQQPRNILLSALASYSWIKMAVVVDEDVDIYSAEDVLWAIQTRCCPDKDLLHIPGVSSYTREDVKEMHLGKFGIDATAPLSKRDILKRRSNPLDQSLILENTIAHLRRDLEHG